MNIPIIIICYNNYKYVKNTLDQILKINKEYYKNIQILNNKSNCEDTIKFLQNVDVKVINNHYNYGPWVSPYVNIHIYNELPDKYILTDPDLELNPNIPTNFIEIMAELSDKYNCGKIGVALDISDFDKMYQNNYVFNEDKNEWFTIYDQEKQFWENKINDEKYILYRSTLDTTFCLVNKKYSYYNTDNNHIRIAGNFTTKHLPWYVENKIYSIYENYLLAKNNEKNISTTSRIIIAYIETNYLKVVKNNEIILLKNKNTEENISSWI